MESTPTPMSTTKLFIATFVSAFFLFAGLGGILIYVSPSLVRAFQLTPEFEASLPVAATRDDDLIDVTTLLGKQLYPPLLNPETVQTGNWIRIPSIGVNVPLALSPTLQDADVIKTLDLGAALYPNGITPGRLGNIFVAAHSTGVAWQGKYRFAFVRINEVVEGNVIHIDHDGTRYTYRVKSQEIIVPDDNYRVISDRPVPTITLMACWPLWSTSKRMLVHAELTNITQLTTPPA